jgi:excisionase family DNA binding protein
MDAHPRAPVPRYAFSLDEAARSISISRRALYDLIGTGAIRTVKLGARRVVPAAELERLLRPQEQQACVAAVTTEVPQ